MMDVNQETVDAVISHMNRVLLSRHTLIENPFTTLHLNRLFTQGKDWPHIKWMMDNYPHKLHYTKLVQIPLDALELPPMQTPTFHATSPHHAEAKRAYVVVSDEHGFMSSQQLKHQNPATFQLLAAGDRAFAKDEGMVTTSHERPVFQRSVDMNCKLYKPFRHWAAQHLKIAAENKRCYDLALMVLDECTSWLQVKKLWPEFVREVNSWKPDDAKIKDRVPDLSDNDGKRARNPLPFVLKSVEEYNRRCIPALIQGGMLYKNRKGIDDNVDYPKSKQASFLKNRVLYEMYGVSAAFRPSYSQAPDINWDWWSTA